MTNAMRQVPDSLQSLPKRQYQARAEETRRRTRQSKGKTERWPTHTNASVGLAFSRPAFYISASRRDRLNLCNRLRPRHSRCSMQAPSKVNNVVTLLQY